MTKTTWLEFDEASRYSGTPLVALVGRPNVGKSSLFNRLLGSRRAITDPTPGVTRDPVTAETFIAGKPLRLVDTGGFRLESDDLDKLVVAKTLETLKQADLIVLVLEAADPTPEDERFIELLRPFSDRLLVVVNKTEGGRREAEAYNYLRYGFDAILMVSAEHGDNISDLETAIIQRLDFSTVKPAETRQPLVRVALIGKPNTGKSSLFNRLIGSDSAIVSDLPGTTRDVVEGRFYYKGHEFQLMDTAGIRRKNRVNENIEYYSVNRAIRSLSESDLVFLLIDAVDGLSDQDKKIAALAHERGRGLIFVLSKWDLMPQLKNNFEAARDRLRFMFGQMDYAPVIAISALDGFGIKKLLEYSLQMYGQLNRKIDTSQLNQALEIWLRENPPPTGPQTRFMLRYATQVSVNPLRFLVFASRPRAVSEAYIAYLRKRIRNDLGFPSVPLAVIIKGSSSETLTGRRSTRQQSGLSGVRRK